MANSHTSIHIRVMTDSDIPIARDLLQQLGYSMSAEEVARRFASVASATGHAVIIAEDGSVMVGLLHRLRPLRWVSRMLNPSYGSAGGGLGAMVTHS